MDKKEKVLSMLEHFCDVYKIDAGAIPLLRNMIENNVAYVDAKQFCAEHFMSETIAHYYEDFFNYVASTKEKQKAVESSELPQDEDTTTEDSSDIQLLRSIDNTLKEILDTLKHV